MGHRTLSNPFRHPRHEGEIGYVLDRHRHWLRVPPYRCWRVRRRALWLAGALLALMVLGARALYVVA